MPTQPTKSDPIRRGIRTLFQVGTVTLAIQGYNLFSTTPLTVDQAAWITAFGTLLVSFAQNALEEAGAVPEMLKGKPVAVVNPALGSVIMGQSNTIERLEAALRDLRADRRQPDAALSVTVTPADHVR